MTRQLAFIISLLVGPLVSLAAAQRMPELNGAAAAQYLKQEGLYGSLGEALDAARYGVRADGPAFAATNPGQNFVMRFDDGGLSLAGSAWRSRWTLRSLGYGARHIPAGAARLLANGTRMELQRGSGITEWYVNGALGLEQGFTLQRPPAAARPGERLRLQIDVAGNLTARENGEGIELLDEAGVVALRYQHLVATDSRNRQLPARMGVANGGVWVEVDDTAATWPVTIDPTFVQQAYLEAPNKGIDDLFGNAVAISGDTVLIGAYQEGSASTGVNGPQTNISTSNAGAAYVFVRSGSTWTLQAYLKASNTGNTDLFGYAVGLSGNTAVIGAPNEASNASTINGDQSNNNAVGSGAAYIFVRSGNNWTQEAYLKPSNTGAGDGFGSAVAISGETVAVGAYLEDSNSVGINGFQNNDLALDSGAVYVFVRDTGVWFQQVYMKSSNSGAGDHFGFSLAVSGTTLVVGASAEDSSSTGVNSGDNNGALDSGAAYVLVQANDTWTQQAYLKASNTTADDVFGFSVGVSGDTVVVGAPGDDSNAAGVGGDQGNNSSINAGSAYVFVRTGTTWSQQAYLKASNPGTLDFFGYSVAISDNLAVIGAPQERSSSTGVNGDQNNDSAVNSGAAYVFSRSGTTWSQLEYLKAFDTTAGDLFGTSAAVSGNTVVVGSWKGYLNGSAFSQPTGSVHIFFGAGICNYSISAPSQNVGASGTSGTVGVTAEAGCTWTATSNDSWLTITSGASGSGNGTVGFQAAANASTTGRTGTLTVAGQTFTVTQAGSAPVCQYTVGAPSLGSNVVIGGGSGTISVTTTAGCAWTATSNASWLLVTGGAAGSGSGTVQYSVLANGGPQRAGALTITGQVVSMTQAGSVLQTQANSLMLGQLVGGGSEWITTILVTNLSGTAENFTIRFYGDGGSAKVMPIATLGFVDSITGTLSPGQSRRYETTSDGVLQIAWAILTPGTAGANRLSGLAVFRQSVPGQPASEAAVDLTGGNDLKQALLFDNVGGFVTSVALVNPDALQSLAILVQILDENGTVLATDAVAVPPLGHKAFATTTQFPDTVGKRGSIRLSAPAKFTGLGLRFSSINTFTSFRLLTSTDIQ